MTAYLIVHAVVYLCSITIARFPWVSELVGDKRPPADTSREHPRTHCSLVRSVLLLDLKVEIELFDEGPAAPYPDLARQARPTEAHRDRIESCWVLFLDYSGGKTSILRIE
jgi:hypothetical protein